MFSRRPRISTALAAPRPPKHSIQAHLRPLPMTDPSVLLMDILNDHRATMASCAGGARAAMLPAEQESFRSLKGETRTRLRRTYLTHVGRRIDLPAMLLLKGSAGGPRWFLSSPFSPRLGRLIDVAWRRNHASLHIYKPPVPNKKGIYITNEETHELHLPRNYEGPDADKEYVPAGGFPVLPARAREIIRHPRVLRRAKWIGVLYQPTSYSVTTIPRPRDPDPAIVVEWQDLPNEYYALAMWGHDRNAIEEWLL